ncbi:hypothetical protein [Brevibacillus laterosporus]|uniref:hypothetical protein n=1 Tax=Brevibacillus laterosporus TaxID=1465 RepID=UPI0018F8A160|nr:hypothetical protein [Brevibacillus laterosporus]MBG9776149.1 hypothetical protein [Brevibacillus laterosporus]
MDKLYVHEIDLDILKANIENSKMFQVMATYKVILGIMQERTDKSGFVKVNQSELGRMLELSQTSIANKLKFLLKYELIKKSRTKKGFYKVLSTNLLEKTPFGTMIAIINIVEDYPEVFSSFAKQSELLGVSLNEIQTAWGFFSYCNGSKYN